MINVHFQYEVPGRPAKACQFSLPAVPRQGDTVILNVSPTLAAREKVLFQVDAIAWDISSGIYPVCRLIYLEHMTD
jgi:hypothetical protein